MHVCMYAVTLQYACMALYACMHTCIHAATCMCVTVCGTVCLRDSSYYTGILIVISSPDHLVVKYLSGQMFWARYDYGNPQ
jgi:hypothetical protein